MKRIAMIIAHEGFRDEELLRPKEILERRGGRVTVVSSKPGTATGKLGATMPVDELLEGLSAQAFDAVVFVGGPGSKAYFDDPAAQRLAKEAVRQDKVLAAICSAGAILARAGVLNGLNATCYPTEAEDLRRGGATYTAKTVETHGKVITGSGPEAAASFGAAIADAIGL